MQAAEAAVGLLEDCWLTFNCSMLRKIVGSRSIVVQAAGAAAGLLEDLC